MKSRIWVVALALMLVCGLSQRWMVAQPTEKAPTQLAVVDIIKVFEALDEKRAGDAEIDKLNAELENQRRKLEESLKRQSEALRPNNPAAMFKPGTPEYKQAQEQLLQDSMNYKAFMAVSEARRMMLKRLKTVEIYRKINMSIEKYARSKGIAIVFCIDELDLDSMQDQSVSN